MPLCTKFNRLSHRLSKLECLWLSCPSEDEQDCSVRRLLTQTITSTGCTASILHPGGCKEKTRPCNKARKPTNDTLIPLFPQMLYLTGHFLLQCSGLFFQTHGSKEQCYTIFFSICSWLLVHVLANSFDPVILYPGLPTTLYLKSKTGLKTKASSHGFSESHIQGN